MIFFLQFRLLEVRPVQNQIEHTVESSKRRRVKAINLETVLFSVVITLAVVYLGSIMGLSNMFSTLMATAHQLLLNTVFYIMAVAVLAGALGSVLTEFGIVALVNRLLSPLMKPLYGMPGAAAMGALTTFLSDNPAIVSLAHDEGFKRYFKKYQVPALCNLGTAFGMGLIIIAYMVGKGFPHAALVGLAGAVFGSVVSVRLMLRATRKYYSTAALKLQEELPVMEDDSELYRYREIREGSLMQRFLEAVLEGGKNGVEMGLAIIPGVLVICTVVLMLTYGAPAQGYTGQAFEGVALLPAIGRKLYGLTRPLLGFSSPEAIAFPVTALGAAGAAVGLVPQFLQNGLIGANDIAVFTAMGMCWSGYLSTHVAMMDALGVRQLTNKAIISHTIGGLSAGIFANLVFKLLF